MLDPLATFLMRVQAAGNDVEPVAALFSRPDDITGDQRAMVDEFVRRSRENGYIADAGDGKVSVTPQGQQFLDEMDL